MCITQGLAQRHQGTTPGRGLSQRSLGQEPEALLAALALGASFVIILTSVVIKLFIG